MENNDLVLIVLESAKDLGEKIQKGIQDLRQEDTRLILKIQESVFSSGERKTKLEESVRGKDVYILCDIGNYGLTYNMRGHINRCSPYDNYKSVKDVIGGISGSAKRISVIMPLLIDSRQHRREGREPLACAQYLQELIKIGVERVITVDVHDPGVKQSIPYNNFDSVNPFSTMLKQFIINEHDKVNFDNFLVISPDQGAGPRTDKIANQLGVPMGSFRKKRDLSKVVNGKNNIVAHEYLGPRIKGRDILVVDDIISSGDSMLDIAIMAKKRGANKIYFMASFALFTQGIERFNEAYEKKLFDKVYTTDFTYIDPDYLNQSWINMVDCSNLLSRIINNLNKDLSISELLSNQEQIIIKCKK